MEINLAFFGVLFISLVIVFLVLYVPGKVICSSFFPKIANKIALSLGVGLGMWALQGYFFGLIHVRFLTWIYLVVSCYLFYKTRPKFKFSLSFLKTNKLLLAIIFFGAIVQNLAVFPSALADSRGIRFYDINAYDGIYYLTLTKNLITNFPPHEPGFSGHQVINYHYFSNLAVADVARLFPLPISLLQFQVFPLLLSLLLGLLVYQLGKDFTGSDTAGKIFAFLAYFGSDFGYVTSLALLKTFSVTNLQPIETSSLLFTNPARAFAEIVFLSGATLLLHSLKEKNISRYLISFIVLISTIGFKIYVGIFSGILIGVAALFGFLKSRNPKFLLILLPVLIIAFLVYLPTNSMAGGLFFAPFAWPRHYFASGALQAVRWHLQEQVFWEHTNIPRLAILYLSYTAVFLFTVLGTRILGILDLLPRIKKEGFRHYLIYFPTLFFLILGIFFLQEVGIYNTFNFFSFASLSLSLLTADLIAKAFKGPGLILASGLLVLLTIPRPLADGLGQIKSLGGGYLIDNNELSALTYLRENSPRNSVVLVAPGNAQDYNSPYVELYSERPTHLSNLNILESHNQPVSERKREVDNLFSGLPDVQFVSKAKDLGIDYIYIKGEAPMGEIFFSNDEVTILKSR
jgi:hypothetical protein